MAGPPPLAQPSALRHGRVADRVGLRFGGLLPRLLGNAPGAQLPRGALQGEVCLSPQCGQCVSSRRHVRQKPRPQASLYLKEPPWR